MSEDPSKSKPKPKRVSPGTKIKRGPKAPTEEKTCRKCEVTKPLSEFSRAGTTPSRSSRHTSYCRPCATILRRTHKRTIPPPKLTGFAKLSEVNRIIILADMAAGEKSLKTIANDHNIKPSTFYSWKRSGTIV